MKEQLITFETAKLAKEKEFGYDFGGTEYVPGFHYDSEDGDEVTEFEMQQEDACRLGYHLRPTQSLLQRWLRDRHQIYVSVGTDCTTAPKFHFEISRFIGNPSDLAEREWDWVFPVQNENWGLDRTYELSLEAGLYEALKLIETPQ